MTTDEIIAALESLPGCTSWEMRADCANNDPDVKSIREYVVEAWFGGIQHIGLSNDNLESAFQQLLDVIVASLAPMRGLQAAIDELTLVSTIQIQTSD